jgi:serine/threonine protein kinase
LESLEVPSGDIYAFFDGFKNIFKALGELHKNNIIHLDVKPMNMVGKKNPDGTYNLRLIDFGLSRKKDKETDNRDFYYYDGKYYTKPYNYPYWSYDLRLLNQSFYTILCSDIQRDILNFLIKVEGEIGGAPDFINEFMLKQLTRELIETKLLKYLNEPSTQEGTKLEILLKSDTFALGLSLYIIYRRLTGPYPDPMDNVYYVTNDKSRAYDAVFELVMNMCNPNPYSRLSVEVAEQAYITTVLPAIQKAYPSVPDVGIASRVKANANAGLGGGSRHRRKRTKKYVKAKKTRAKPKRK